MSKTSLIDSPGLLDTRALTDTHAHLCDGSFSEDLEEVLDRAAAGGVGGVVAVGENLEDAKANLALADRFGRRVMPAAGLFPTVLDRAEAAAVEEFIRHHRERLAAIGEVGLDYWKVRDVEERELQRDIFGGFIDLAIELDLPLNVHSRSAGAATLEMLIDRGATRVQMHAFDGRAARAEPGVEAGFFFSVPPSIVRSPQKQKLVRRLPLSCLLLETDSPVLGPDTDGRNEPANASISLGSIAELKDVTLAEARRSVVENTARLYGSGAFG